MGLQINLGLQQQLIVLIVSLPLGLHPSPLGPSSFSTRGLYPSPLGPSPFSTWAFSLYLANFMILISYYHLNISRASVVLFRALRYVMRDENLEIGQIQAKGLTGKGRRPKWRRIKPPSGKEEGPSGEG